MGQRSTKQSKITTAEARAIRQGTLRSLVDLVGGRTRLGKIGGPEHQGTTQQARQQALRMRFSFKSERQEQPESMGQRVNRVIRALTNSLHGLESFFQPEGVASAQ